MRACVLSLLGLMTVAVNTGVAQTLPSPALLVGEKSAGQLAIVDPATLRVVGRVRTEPNAHEVATDGKYAYVSIAGGTSIVMVDLATQTRMPDIPLGGLGTTHGLWVFDGKLYFANEGAQTIGRYDPALAKIDWILGTGQPRSHLLVVSRDGSKIFTTNGGAGTVSIIERVTPPARPQGTGGAGGGAPGAAGNRPNVQGGAGQPGGGGGSAGGFAGQAGGSWTITVLPAGRGVEGLAISPDEKEFWAVNVQDKTITAIDIPTKQVVATIPLVTNYSNRLKFTPDGRYVLVTDLRGNEIIVVDAATRKEVRRVKLAGGAEGLLIQPDGSRAYAAVSGSNLVSVVDLETWQVVGQIANLQTPDGMAWIAAR